MSEQLAGAAVPAAQMLGRAIELHQRGELQQAERLYREVLGDDPRNPDALHFLGMIAQQTGHYDDAIALMRRSIGLRPGYALFHNNLGGALQLQRRYDDAIVSYRRALELEPRYAEARYHLAITYAEQAQFEPALANLRCALDLNPGYLDAQMHLAATLEAEGDTGAAVREYLRAADFDPVNAGHLQRVGTELRNLDAREEAKNCYRRAIAADGRCTDALNSLGVMLADEGDFEAARKHYRQALAADPCYTRACLNLLTTTKVTADDADFAAALALEKRTDLNDERRVFLGFALGKAYEDQGDFANAFGHFHEASRIKRASINYPAEMQAQFFGGLMQHLGGEWIRAHEAAGSDDATPIFILGLSRSGTTLVEQILGSHPDMHAAGELHALRQAAHTQIAPHDEDLELAPRVGALDDKALAAIGRNYLRRLQYRGAGKARVTDKLPGNFALVPLIHTLFPRATIIYCRRNPLDVCVSCYTKLFSLGHDFSYDLIELGNYYVDYRRLMDYWRESLPAGRMVEVVYEDLVDDLEGETRKLLAACDLPWNDACLEFHRSRRPVKTASLYQVRQPIYRGSVGRWRRYEPYIQPLIDIVGADAEA